MTLNLYKNEITALIGPSGCGKSTFIRCLNRMNDLIPSARVEGKLGYHGEDLYDEQIDPVQVRKRIGMVFQKPNPFPKSIYENIAFGPRVIGMKGDMDEIVERALRRGALWDEVKDRLKTNAFGMSGGQQQRLCIARALATSPDVLLMDEPCSALDPISTGRIEDLMFELKNDYSIVIVTHNMQQAARVSDMTAFFTVELDDDGRDRTGAVVEYAATDKVFTNPDDKRTEDYVTGKVGLMAEASARVHFQHELQTLEEQALGALDLVVSALDRTMEALHHQDIELASIVILDDDRLDGRYLEVHQGVLSLLALQAPVASDLRTVAALLHVIKHAERMGDQCVNIAKMLPLSGPRAAGRRRDAREDRADGPARALGGRAVQAGVLAPRRRPGRGPRAPGRAGQPAQPRVLPPRRRDRDRRGPARVGDDDDARFPRAGADRGQRGRHRRAGRVRGHGAVPGVLGRLASHALTFPEFAGHCARRCDPAVNP